jgi:GTP-binding protein Era
MTIHKAGFVNIIGKPNAGKSTLLNELMGAKLSIITPKIQTTRHRIQGIINGEDYQMVVSDTPGVIEKTGNKLHERMMRFVDEAVEDADIFLYVVDISENWRPDAYSEKVIQSGIPVVLVLNKIDLTTQEKLEALTGQLKSFIQPQYIVPVSTTEKFNTDALLNLLITLLPEGPAFYDKEQMTDKSERFIASEMIREKILYNYRDEIPYAVEVGINQFKDTPGLLRISAEIYVMRDSQKTILIGTGGAGLKRVGTAARKDMEAFWGKKVFLELFVKVKKDWRDDDLMLKHFGYGE